jgi:murein DD-endopeptidase MepM/ murein hydrolase activator NlpD
VSTSATIDPTRPTFATLATDAYNLSPLSTVEDAFSLIKHLWALVVPRVQAITTAYKGASKAYADGLHHGVDLAAPLGAPILAPMPGTIVQGPPGFNGPNALGNGIYERLDDGTLLVFGHTIAGPSVPVGTRVAAAQQIGSVGSSGNSTGPHVHFQVLPAGVTNPLRDVDPLAWLKSHSPGWQFPPLPGLPTWPTPAPVPTPPSSPQPNPTPAPGPAPVDPTPAPAPADGTHGEPPALPQYTATLGNLGPFVLKVDLTWWLRLLLTLVAIWLIVYGLMKLADVAPPSVKDLTSMAADAAIPG